LLGRKYFNDPSNVAVASAAVVVVVTSCVKNRSPTTTTPHSMKAKRSLL